MKIARLAFLSFLCLTGINEVSAVTEDESVPGLRRRSAVTDTDTTDTDTDKIDTDKTKKKTVVVVKKPPIEKMPDVNKNNDNLRRSSSTSIASIDLMQAPKPIQGVKSRRVIVRYESGQWAKFVHSMEIAERQRTPGQPKLKVNYDFSNRNTYVITADPTVVESLKLMDGVVSIKDDPIRYPFSSPNSLNKKNEDDIFFSSSRDDESKRVLRETMPYGVKMVKAPEVWEKGYGGENVKICVIDSGLDIGHRDFITSNLNGVNTAQLDWNEDGCGHGTHVTGTIVGRDNDEGVIGVAPKAEIITIRVFGNNCEWAYSSDLYDAAQTCRDNGANIISMSLGGPTRDDLEDELFEELAKNGVISIAAAGNSMSTRFMYPASYKSVMSVAAVNRWKRHARFSQRNEQVDIAAPGVKVLSAFPDRCKICGFFPIKRGYGWIDGTSMACPHVSGVAALLLSAKPDATVTELREAMEQSAEDLGAKGHDNLYGNGLVDADAALKYLVKDNSSASLTKRAPSDQASSCIDFPSDWHDANGSIYNCNWYAQGTNCPLYGDGFDRQGFTANEACCACGGGSDAPES